MLIDPLIDILYRTAHCPLSIYHPDGSLYSSRRPRNADDIINSNRRECTRLLNLLQSADKPLLLTYSRTIGGLRLPDGMMLLLGPLPAALKGQILKITVHAVNALLESLFISARRIYPQNLEIRGEILEQAKAAMENLNEQDLSAVLPIESPHNDYASELATLEAITAGDPDMTMRTLARPIHGKLGILGPTALRSARNHVICSAVLGSRAAIRGGVAVETAYTVADYYINGAEKTGSAEQCQQMIRECYISFARLVQQQREHGTRSYSPLTIRAVDEIKRRIYLKTDTAHFASVLGRSSDHIERVFRADTGQSLMSYLTTVRLEVACDLLIHSQRPISEIALILTFSSASHFARVFKARYNMSPREYRERNFQLTPPLA